MYVIKDRLLRSSSIKYDGVLTSGSFLQLKDDHYSNGHLSK